MVDKADHSRKRRALAAAYALKNLEGWEHKVADKTVRFIRAADAARTEPLKGNGIVRPEPADLTLDYRAFVNFFTADAIADIGLSERLGLLDQGHDLVTAERMNGTKYKANFRACLHATAKVQSQLTWVEKWFEVASTLSKWLSPELREYWRLNENWNDIIWSRASERFRRYKAGEKLPDFFESLMKHSKTNPLEWGEIVAEASIMMNAGSDTTAIAINNVMF